MSGSESFRATVQPLVRSAAMRGASAAEITAELRLLHGHAYRRSELLADIRSYRDPSSAVAPTSNALASAISTYRDLRVFIARIGVAAFSVSLFLPAVVHGGASDHVMLASSVDEPVALVAERMAIPNAREMPRLVIASPTPEPTVAPTLAPTPVPTPAPPVDAPMPNGLSGVVLTASWYGPGFYDNRLPCWQWLQANRLPIQFEADTWGVAHKTLPCGTMLTLSHGSNIVTVPVVDRGPYVAGRELDLSLRVKTALGCTDLCTVVMHIGQ